MAKVGYLYRAISVLKPSISIQTRLMKLGYETSDIYEIRRCKGVGIAKPMTDRGKS